MPESLPQELRDLGSRLGDFLRSELRPLEEAATDQQELARERAAARRMSTERGFWNLLQPDKNGTTQFGALGQVVMRETLAGSGLRLADSVLGPDPGLLRLASGELRKSHLQAVLDGTRRGAFAFTEPREATEPTEARRDGKIFRVNGKKSYVTGGADADFYITLVNVRAEDSDSTGTALLVIDRDLPGITVERAFHSLDGSHHLALSLEEVKVPAECLLGGIGEGMPKALRNISEVRLAVAARSTGICLFVLEQLEDQLRKPHRSGSPLADHEAIRLRFADLRIATLAARSTLYRTARIAESGDNAVNEIMATKILCTETVARVVDEGIQLSGGQALIYGHPFERLYREVRTLRLAEGANDLLRLQIARGTFEYSLGRV